MRGSLEDKHVCASQVLGDSNLWKLLISVEPFFAPNMLFAVKLSSPNSAESLDAAGIFQDTRLVSYSAKRLSWP